MKKVTLLHALEILLRGIFALPFIVIIFICLMVACTLMWLLGWDEEDCQCVFHQWLASHSREAV